MIIVGSTNIAIKNLKIERTSGLLGRLTTIHRKTSTDINTKNFVAIRKKKM